MTRTWTWIRLFLVGSLGEYYISKLDRDEGGGGGVLMRVGLA